MEVKARIAGTVVAIHAHAGDTVKVRDILGIMEAMKMEQPIPSPKEGEVAEVYVAVGDKVKPGQLLFLIE